MTVFGPDRNSFPLQLQFCGSDGNMSLQLQFGTVTYKKWSSKLFSENYSYSHTKKWFSNSKCNDFEKNGKAPGRLGHLSN